MLGPSKHFQNLDIVKTHFSFLTLLLNRNDLNKPERGSSVDVFLQLKAVYRISILLVAVSSFSLHLYAVIWIIFW